MHLKRQKSPKIWPIPRKETTFIVRPNFNYKKSIPILIVLRDLLKLAQNRKEVKMALNSKQVFLNEKPIKDEKHSVQLFDTIRIVPSNKSYRLEVLENRRFGLSEIKEKEAEKKIAKVVDKKILKGSKKQINLSDGSNYLSDVECKTNDSVVVDFKNKKIVKCLPLQEKAKAVIFEGKHIGKNGVIDKVDLKNKLAEISVGKEKINVLIKQLMVVE